MWALQARGSGVSFGRTPPQRHWRSYGNDPLPDRRAGHGQAVRRVPELVPAHRVRIAILVRQSRPMSLWVPPLTARLLASADTTCLSAITIPDLRTIAVIISCKPI
jgi:hypothetical protein